MALLGFEVFAVGAGLGVLAGACDLGIGGEIMTGTVMPRGEKGFPSVFIWVWCFSIGQIAGMGIELGGIWRGKGHFLCS